MRSLRLPISPEEIGDSTPLFGEGLGLDSIDVLELVLELERSFGVAITRRRDRHPGPAIGRHDRRLHHGRGQQEAGMTAAGGRARARPRTRSRSTSRSGSTSAASADALGAGPLGPPAVARGRDRRALLLDELDRGRRSRDVLRRRLGCRAASDAGRRDRRAPATKSARTATSHTAGLRARRRRLRSTMSGGASRRFDAAGAPACARSARRSGRSTSGRCGRSRLLAREGFTIDASMAPVRIVGSPDYPRHPHVRHDRGRSDPRGAAARRRPVRAGHAARLGLGPAHELAGARAAGDRAGERTPACRRC